MSERKTFVLQAVGDLRLRVRERDRMFDAVRPLLRKCDVLFGNCEGPIAAPLEQTHRCGEDCEVGALRRAGFTVMSCANNHIFDEGRDALLRTVELLSQHGIATCGAGPTPVDAHRPAIMQVGETRVGFLAYTSVGPKNTGPRPAEVAHISAETAYSNLEPWQPGSPAKIATKAREEDLTALTAAIAAVRSTVDLLFVSFHWGIHLLPYVITDYERELARAAIDAGAEAVLGHHQHVLSGIEFYRDRPIFYGLGELAFAEDLPDDVVAMRAKKHDERYGEYNVRRYPGRRSILHPISRMRVIARLSYAGGRLGSLRLIPCVADRMSRPIPQAPASPGGKRVLAFLRQVNELAGLRTELRYDGGPHIDVRPARDVVPSNRPVARKLKRSAATDAAAAGYASGAAGK
jgi:hypothetical protein